MIVSVNNIDKLLNARMADLVPIYLKLRKEDISTVKFILETYDDIALVRTLDAESGEIAVLATSDTEGTARAILTDLAKEMEIAEIAAPDSVRNDWLLQL